MILNQKVKIKITVKNLEHFKWLGYKPIYHIDKNGVERLKQEIIEIEATDLPKNSHALVKVVCDNCGKVYNKEIRRTIKGNDYCCDECQSEYKSNKELERFSSIIDGNAKYYLYQKYVIDRKTTREIAILVYGNIKNASTITGWIKRIGLEEELRHGSEAIKTQWENNNERKIQASINAKIHLDRKEIRGKIHKTQQTQEYRIKQSECKKGNKNGMYGVVGDNHPNWNSNRTHEERVKERKTLCDAKWRNGVFERDNYICKCCSYDKGNILVAHHLDSYDVHADVRYDVDNGITLCKPCHKKFHSTYGYGNNTKEQYIEFEKNIKKVALAE